MIGGRPENRFERPVEYNPEVRNRWLSYMDLEPGLSLQSVRKGDEVYFVWLDKGLTLSEVDAISHACIVAVLAGPTQPSITYPLVYLRKDAWTVNTPQIVFRSVFRLVAEKLDRHIEEQVAEPKQREQEAARQARLEKFSQLRALNDGSFELALQQEILDEIRKLVGK